MSGATCPVCRCEVHQQAVVCPHCHSPLGFINPLLARLESLEVELNTLKQVMGSHAPANEHAPDIENSMSASHQQAGLGPQDLADTIPGVSNSRWIMAGGITVMVNLLLHGLMLFVYDQPPIILRISTLLAPMLTTSFLCSGRRSSAFALSLASTASATASVVAMLGLTAHIDQVPLWPDTLRDWTELLEYAVGIALGFGTGGLLARALALQKASSDKRAFLLLLLQRDSSGHYNIEALVDRINRFLMAAAPIATGALGLYSGLRSMLSSN